MGEYYYVFQLDIYNQTYSLSAFGVNRRSLHDAVYLLNGIIVSHVQQTSQLSIYGCDTNCHRYVAYLPYVFGQVLAFICKFLRQIMTLGRATNLYVVCTILDTSQNQSAILHRDDLSHNGRKTDSQVPKNVREP